MYLIRSMGAMMVLPHIPEMPPIAKFLENISSLAVEIGCTGLAIDIRWTGGIGELIQVVQDLVPEYTPSELVLGLASGPRRKPALTLEAPFLVKAAGGRAN